MKTGLTAVGLSIVLAGCAGTSGTVSGLAGAGAVASVSPVLTVLNVTQTVYDIATSGKPEYQVRIRSVDISESEALRLAKDEACRVTFGSTVASEQASNGGRLVRDEVISYTGCYVKDYKIVARDREQNGEVSITADFTVSGNKLSNRLLGDSKHDQSFNGEQHATRIQTYQQNMTESDRLVDTVVRDFPARAYRLEVARIQTVVKPDRTGVVRVDYLIELDDNYLDSLRNLFEVTGKTPSGKIMGAYPIGKWGISNPVAEVTVPGFMSTTTYQWSDQITWDRIRGGLTKPQWLVVSARHGGRWSHLNGGDWRWTACFPAAWNTDNSMISLGSRGGRFRTNQVWYNFGLEFRTAEELDYLSSITDIKLEVTSDGCPKK